MHWCYWIHKDSHIPIKHWRRVKFKWSVSQNVEINREAKWWQEPLERNPVDLVQRPRKIRRMQWIYVPRQKYYEQHLRIIEHTKNWHWEIQSC